MLEVRDISKTYGVYKAIEELSFSMDRGEIVGLLGSNGAGKSTTMNMLAGYFPPSSGTITIDGKDSVQNPMEYKSKIAYLPENSPLYPDFSVGEQLDLLCRFRNIPKSQKKREIERVAELCKISDVMNRRNGNMSKGYRRRIGLAQTLIGNPSLIILDEPTAGLDPRQTVDFRAVLEGLGDNQSVLISSHILTEISQVADRILVLKDRRIAADRSLAGHDGALSEDSLLTVRIEGDLDRIQEILASLGGVSDVVISDRSIPGCPQLQIRMDSDADIRRALFRKMADIAFPILEMTMKKTSLEEFFIGLTTKE